LWYCSKLGIRNLAALTVSYLRGAGALQRGLHMLAVNYMIFFRESSELHDDLFSNVSVGKLICMLAGM